MPTKLPFHARGAVYAAAARVALEAGLRDDAAEGLLAVMLAYVQGDDMPAQIAQTTPPSLPPIDMPPERLSRALIAAGYWVARGTAIENLGQHHGTVLLGGAHLPVTYRVGYRDLEGVVRLADDGVRADWAVAWWPLP